MEIPYIAKTQFTITKSRTWKAGLFNLGQALKTNLTTNFNFNIRYLYTPFACL